MPTCHWVEMPSIQHLISNRGMGGIKLQEVRYDKICLPWSRKHDKHGLNCIGSYKSTMVRGSPRSEGGLVHKVCIRIVGCNKRIMITSTKVTKI